MIDLGLGQTEMNKLIALLFKPHQIAITIAVMDMNHNFIGDVSHRLVSGQVNFDTTSEVSRTLDLELLDPNSKLGLNPDHPENGAVYLDKMIRVTYSVAAPVATTWYHIPIFTGPVTGLTRTDIGIKVTAAGKDSLAYASFWKNLTFGKGQTIMHILKTILRDVLGEAKFNLPYDYVKKVGKNTTITNENVPWDMIRKFAGSLSLYPFYDGRGVLQFRRDTRKPVFTFTDDHLMSRPEFTYDPSTIINSVLVIGAKPEGPGKEKPRWREAADNKHPLSPHKLGRDNAAGERVGRYYTQVVEDGNLDTEAECKQRAKDLLKKGLIESVEVQASALPMPLLEEGDLYHLRTDDVDMVAKMTQWTIPLTSDGVMTLGNVRRVSQGTKRKRKKPKDKSRGRGKQRASR